MRTLSTRNVYTNPWMSVREDAIRRADGSDGVYGVVDKPDYALVIPIESGGIQLVEQFRYAVGLRRWEFPQGTAPNGADVQGARLAADELREETGLRARRLTDLGRVDVAPGMSSQRGRVFLATGLIHGEPARELEEQDMRMAWFPRTEFEDMIRRGEISDSQSLAAYSLLLLHESAHPQ